MHEELNSLSSYISHPTNTSLLPVFSATDILTAATQGMLRMFDILKGVYTALYYQNNLLETEQIVLADTLFVFPETLLFPDTQVLHAILFGGKNS